MIPFLGTLTVPTIIIGFAVGFVVWLLTRTPSTEKRDGETNKCDVSKEQNCCSSSENCCKTEAVDAKSDKYRKNVKKSGEKVERVKILFASTTGNSQHFAGEMRKCIESEAKIRADCVDLKAYDFENELSKEKFVVVITSTHSEGTPPESAKYFFDWLRETADDFRVQHSLLADVRFAVFGLGNSLYSDHFNTNAKNCDRNLYKLSAKRFFGLTLGDENVANSKHGSLESDFDAFKTKLTARIKACNDQTSDFEENSDELNEESEFSESDSDEIEFDEAEDGLVDMEDMGAAILKGREKAKTTAKEPKEMITPLLRKSLTKQGYKLIGSHSGVKICRWTKAMLRGRGGCYKHSFYGIESHRCMETTPSLACANKCVFCWRHHSNPVGTEWKWKMDEPEEILKGALENHYKMIKQMKGVPGVQMDRFEEGMKAKHCALSLVGEPIMYPKIGQFIKLLHEREISSFLVTNAQFPDAIREIGPCTQLYVSIDASTKDSLKKIDRPLFRDFWERFIDSLKELSRKGQRTVYRLTLVKGYNAEELDNYAKLVQVGNPDFIEVKGVTYCGSSKASSLTMENVPWHEEVVGFVQGLVDRIPGGEYEIACEHEHSNCVLVAHKKFKVDGEWRTWINYAEFHRLVRNYNECGVNFSAMDYAVKTPDWAVFGSKERGFDPVETRFHRKRNKREQE